MAEATRSVDSMREKSIEIERQLIAQKRVNEILSRNVERSNFSEKGMRLEFNRINAENKQLLEDIRQLKTTNSNPNPTQIITPPDSSSEKSSKGIRLIYLYFQIKCNKFRR